MNAAPQVVLGEGLQTIERLLPLTRLSVLEL